MRDGVKLFTTVYVPKDASQPYPILMERTPYSVAPYGIDNYRSVIGPSEAAEKEGFIFVYQDVRGRCMSEGEFVDVPFHKTHFSGPADTDESTDTYDTVDWLVKHVPGNNGRVGIWGISYPGFYAAFALIGAHPALKAVSPQAPMGDVGNGDDAFHNGAFYLAANFGFYRMFWPREGGPAVPVWSSRFDLGTPDAYAFYLRMGPLQTSNEKYFKGKNPYWDVNLDHPNYDEFWQSRALAPIHEGHQAGRPLRRRLVRRRGPRRPAQTLQGPGEERPRRAGHACHGALAARRLGGHGRRPARKPQLRLEDRGVLPRIDRAPVLRRAPQGPRRRPEADEGRSVPKAWLFATGVNEWRRFDAWPPREAREKSLYFCPGGKLSFEPSAAAAGAFDEYVSDPAKPVPVIGRIGLGHARRLHERGPALRLAPHRRPRL